MSFLNNIRLTFHGKFQADVSTVNNDVRHYDSDTFQPEYQKFADRETGVQNGWWNPTGSGAFRLIGCKITGVSYGDGSATSTREQDRAIGLRVGGSDDHTSAKIVDIDPQWQLASALWGLDVRLTNGNNPDFFTGHYRPHAFRDLWFGRMLRTGGDGGAAATFQSVLENVEWARDLDGSRALTELKRASQSGRLSIRLTTFGFSGRNPNSSDFTIGTVVGVIGPYLAREPESFVLGRRFAPANGSKSWNGCSYFSGHVDSSTKNLFLDLSNAFSMLPPNSDSTKGPLVPIGAMNDIGKIQAGILLDPNAAEFTPATSANFVPIGEIDYRTEAWLLNTSGVVALPLNDEQLALTTGHPLALAAINDLDSGSGMNGEFGQIAIRETGGGLFVEAEPLVHRIDAPGKSEATVYATRFGVPMADAEVRINQLGPMPNQGGDGGGNPNPPPAAIPNIGVPTDKFKAPLSVRTKADGTAALAFSAEAPGNPRKYIDGQLYLLDFRLRDQGNQARSQFDYIVTHVRDAVDVPADPSWTDVAAILTQYANLYPVMSRLLVNLSNPHDVNRHAKLLHLAFSQPIDSSNHMPVTRDLSARKREMILKFLQKIIDGKDTALEAALTAVPAASTPNRHVQPPEVVKPDGKTTAARNFSDFTGRPSV